MALYSAIAGSNLPVRYNSCACNSAGDNGGTAGFGGAAVAGAADAGFAAGVVRDEAVCGSAAPGVCGVFAADDVAAEAAPAWFGVCADWLPTLHTSTSESENALINFLVEIIFILRAKCWQKSKQFTVHRRHHRRKMARQPAACSRRLPADQIWPGPHSRLR